MSSDAVPASAPRQSSLLMRRPNLDGLPRLTPPSGYVLRVAEDTNADVKAVGTVLGGAFPDMNWSPAKTRERLWDDATVKTVFLITDQDGQPVATASARLADEHPGSGYVHWVGANPTHLGKGLGYAATLATLHEFRRQGLASAVLETDDFRIPALRVYGRLGFRPGGRDDSHPPRWAAIYAAHPDLAALLESNT